MSTSRLKWKFLFFILCALFATTLYDSFNVPEIIAPTHPLWVSIAIYFIDSMALLGCYSFAFKKQIFPIENFWKAVILSLFSVNALALFYEFSNRADGYEVYDMIYTSIFMAIIVGIMALPVYLYLYQDLSNKRSAV